MYKKILFLLLMNQIKRRNQNHHHQLAGIVLKGKKTLDK